MTSLPKPEVAANRKQAVEKVCEALSERGIQVFYLDGREISNKETFLAKAAEVMKFPLYFGMNWDAFEECITDLTWSPAEQSVLIYERPDIFAQADPNNWQTALDILHAAEEYWQARNIPLSVFLLS
ncbi:barnase inhibitor [Calothrix sp. NIES-4071]|nr:barnase inhibitor [Calothrix sp. NIES-4071]BAZ61642.1 barnase inhibitor [Calothrix sp. NIES-4105]